MRRPSLSRIAKTVQCDDFPEGLDTELRYEIQCEGWFVVQFTVTLPMENVGEFKEAFEKQVQWLATENGVKSTATRIAKRFGGSFKERV